MSRHHTTLIARWLLLGLATLAWAACEKAQEGKAGLPIVEVVCQTAECKSHSGQTKFAFIYITGSSCSAISFDLQATGAAQVTCNGLGCQGEVRSWYGRDEDDVVTTIEAGFYSICGLIDFNDSVASDSDPFADDQDAHIEVPSVDFGSIDSRITLEDWIDP